MSALINEALVAIILKDMRMQVASFFDSDSAFGI